MQMSCCSWERGHNSGELQQLAGGIGLACRQQRLTWLLRNLPRAKFAASPLTSLSWITNHLECWAGISILMYLPNKELFSFLFFKNVYKPGKWEQSSKNIPNQLRASPAVLSMWPCRNISHIQGLVNNFFPTPPIELKLEPWVGERLLIATHLDQSSYLTIPRAINKYDMCVYIRLFQGSSRALKDVHIFRVPVIFHSINGFD
jgi:hypothetical protein